MHKLRVLKLVFPELCYRQYYPDQAYHEAANKIFDILSQSCPQLFAVVLTPREDSGPDAWYFVRSKKIGDYGQVKFLGLDVAPYVVREYEPCSDMLEPEKMVFG